MTNLAFEDLIQKLENSRQNKVGVVLDWTGILKSTCTFQLSLTLHSFSFQKHWTVINTFQNIVKSSCSSGEILWKCVNIWLCFSSVCQYKKVWCSSFDLFWVLGEDVECDGTTMREDARAKVQSCDTVIASSPSNSYCCTFALCFRLQMCIELFIVIF